MMYAFASFSSSLGFLSVLRSSLMTMLMVIRSAPCPFISSFESTNITSLSFASVGSDLILSNMSGS